jgi:hypothetical protein
VLNPIAAMNELHPSTKARILSFGCYKKRRCRIKLQISHQRLADKLTGQKNKKSTTHKANSK